MKYKPIIIGVIIFEVSMILFILMTPFYNEKSESMVYVHGTVTTNSTLIPCVVSFYGKTSNGTNIENGSYSIMLPNNHSYEVEVFSNYKVPPPMPNITRFPVATRAGPECFNTSFDLHANSTQFEYDISCLSR